jgi:tetratricopeptide (TPR) repeat protein
MSTTAEISPLLKKRSAFSAFGTFTEQPQAKVQKTEDTVPSTPNGTTLNVSTPKVTELQPTELNQKQKLNKAFEFFSAKKYQASIAFLLAAKVEKTDPLYGEVQCKLGYGYLALKDDANAKLRLKEALSCKMYSATASFYLGVISYKSGNFDESIKYLYMVPPKHEHYFNEQNY